MSLLNQVRYVIYLCFDFLEDSALYELIDYLSEQRGILLKILFVNGEDLDGSISNMCELIDTTLLRIYLSLNDPLISSLLRTKNHCNSKTVEELLTIEGVINHLNVVID